MMKLSITSLPLLRVKSPDWVRMILMVGTAETVAQAMVDYYDLGAGTLLIRGYDPLDDAEQYGRELIPRVRALVAERERERGGARVGPSA